jgi:hypothetical protein
MSRRRKPKILIHHVGVDEFRGEIGIHLLEPTSSELENAFEQAESQMFDQIICHWDNVYSLDTREAQERRAELEAKRGAQ